MKSRHNHIDTLRGIAVILMVMGHVIGFNEQQGMSQPRGSFLYTVFFFFHPLRMPLFTAISGFIYGLKPASQQTFGSAIERKIHRLLIPMISIGMVQIVFNYYVLGYGSLGQITTLFYKSYEHLWFLQAMMLIFLVMILCDAWKLTTNRLFSVSMACTLLFMCLFTPYHWNIFSFGGMASIFPGFMVGYALSRHKISIKKSGLALVFVVSMCFYLSHRLDVFYLPETLFRLCHLAAGLAGCGFLLQLNLNSKILSRIGFYSYGVYLFHMFILGPMKKFALPNMSSNTSLLTTYFFLALASAVGIPIIMTKLLDLSHLAGAIFLGKRLPAPTFLSVSRISRMALLPVQRLQRQGIEK